MESASDKALQYKSLRADDRDEIDDLEAHIRDDETIDLDDYIQPEPRSRVRRIIDSMHRFWWLIDGFLIAIIIMLLVDRQFVEGGKTKKYEVASDITGFAPEFSKKIVTFQPDPGFLPKNTSEFWSPEVRQKWLSIVPKGLGYLDIKEPKKYTDLPHKLTGGYSGNYVVTTSMTHQLHCLYAIAEVFSAYAANNTEKIPSEGPWHLAHCFDYIRQGIMCAGDVAVEGDQTTFPDGFVGSDGWDAKHVCKNYDEVLDYLTKNAINDDAWI